MEIPTIRFPLGLLIPMKFERKNLNDPFIIVTQNCYAELYCRIVMQNDPFIIVKCR